MTKERAKSLLESFSCIINVNQKIKDVEESLSENNLSFDNLITIFVYNRENEIELSLFTSPDKHIKLKYIKN